MQCQVTVLLVNFRHGTQQTKFMRYTNALDAGAEGRQAIAWRVTVIVSQQRMRVFHYQYVAHQYCAKRFLYDRNVRAHVSLSIKQLLVSYARKKLPIVFDRCICLNDA